MDFARINTLKNAATGATMHLTMVDGTERLYKDNDRTKPIEIILQSLESPVGKRLVAKQAREEATNNMTKEKLADASVDYLLGIMDKTEADKVDICVALTVGWNNITYLEDDAPDDAEGTVMRFSEANARKLYSTRPWIMEKINDFLNNRSNFLPKSVKD